MDATNYGQDIEIKRGGKTCLRQCPFSMNIVFLYCLAIILNKHCGTAVFAGIHLTQENISPLSLKKYINLVNPVQHLPIINNICVIGEICVRLTFFSIFAMSNPFPPMRFFRKTKQPMNQKHQQNNNHCSNNDQ